ncbi:MAG TPA: hypothetical protein VJO33_17295 [Gemmatimonadaceae bacterium]|nr:hypothetical protein [Gemmatimonadaceae bacterium]
MLNPPGCFIRQSLEGTLRQRGIPFEVAAAINNIDMQLSLVASAASGLSPRDFSPRIPSAGGWSESSGPASALRLQSCSCKPAIWAGSKPRRHFFKKSFETISPGARFVDPQKCKTSKALATTFVATPTNSSRSLRAGDGTRTHDVQPGKLVEANGVGAQVVDLQRGTASSLL